MQFIILMIQFSFSKIILWYINDFIYVIYILFAKFSISYSKIVAKNLDLELEMK